MHIYVYVHMTYICYHYGSVP